MKKLFIPFLIVLIMASVSGYSQGGEKTEQGSIESGGKNNYSIVETIKLKDFSFSEFPTLHPMAVHIPLMLIPLSFIFYISGLFLKNFTLKISGTLLISAGFAGAVVIFFFIHPHTSGLPGITLETLNKHDFFAVSTMIFSGISALMMAAGNVFLKRRKIYEYITLIILFLSVLSVSATGHYGGKLVYVHGVGAMGKYLDK